MKEVEIPVFYDKFKPESCVFVLSVDQDGNPSGMIAGWNMKCSMNPPLFAVALSKGGNTRKLIETSQEFVVAVPNKKMEKDLLYFGNNKGAKLNKFADTNIKTEKAKFLKTPLLVGATLNIECKVHTRVDSGDHIIFIGKILTAYHNEGQKIMLNMKKEGNNRIFEEF